VLAPRPVRRPGTRGSTAQGSNDRAAGPVAAAGPAG